MKEFSSCYNGTITNRNTFNRGWLFSGFINDIQKQHQLSTIIPNDVTNLIEDFYPYMTCIIDNGSIRIKAGFTGNDSPQIDIPSFVGLVRDRFLTFNFPSKYDEWYGERAHRFKFLFRARFPVQNCVITDFDNMVYLLY